jgi:hypothetical protein
MKKGEFGGLQTHDWNTFIKVIILVYMFIYCPYTFFNIYFLSTLETDNDSLLLLQYVLSLSLPNEFDKNVKQVIYDLGKYMR